MNWDLSDCEVLPPLITIIPTMAYLKTNKLQEDFTFHPLILKIKSHNATFLKPKVMAVFVKAFDVILYLQFSIWIN